MLFSRSEQPSKKTTAPAPPVDADPSKLITHLALHDPLKLALARDFPLVVRKLQKTERGIKRMQKDAARAQGSGDLPQLNQGLGWLHYRKFQLTSIAKPVSNLLHLRVSAYVRYHVGVLSASGFASRGPAPQLRHASHSTSTRATEGGCRNAGRSRL